MDKTIKEKITQPFFRNMLPNLLTLVGFVYYARQAFHYAHTLFSTMDEGSFLYKGYLFASGVYRIYQPYGPFTGKMPLSFFIPGWVQMIFGPGLRTGRYFAVVLALMTLLCLWLLTKKLTNSWYACFVVWAFSLNAYFAKNYSQVFSQVLVASMLSLLLLLCLGNAKKLWQTTAAGVLAALIVFTRHDIFPIVLFSVFYIFWRHGKRAGLWAALSAGATLLVGHLIFWPHIITIWLNVLPGFLANVFDQFIFQPGTSRAVVSNIDFLGRALAFWEGIRMQYVPVVGSITALLFWSKRKNHSQSPYFKELIFLSVTFATLAAMHFWASITRNYCVFCFKGYLSFYSFFGLLILAITLHQYKPRTNAFKNIIAVLLVIATTTGVLFSTYQDLGAQLLTVQVPRLKDMKLLSGTVSLSTFLENKFAIPFDQLKYLIPAGFGLLAGLLILLISIIIANKLKKPFFAVLSLTLLAIAFFLTPFKLMTDMPLRNECEGDVLAAYERAGSHMLALIPQGTKVWWAAPNGAVPLTYLQGIYIYPPQLNNGFNFFVGGDSDYLWQHGYWNEELDKRWLDDADFAIIENPHFYGKYVQWINPQEFAELTPTNIVHQCEGEFFYRIFRRIAQNQ